MSIPYIQASMANVRAVEGTFISYPFLEDGDTDTKVYNMTCTQLATDYNSSQVALDTPMTTAAQAGVIALPFSSDSGAYFVGDTGHTSIGGGMLSFTRTFANIPQSITIPSGSAFVTFPGISRTVTPSGALNATGVTMTPADLGITITTDAAHGLSEGSQVYLSMSYNIDLDPFIHQVAGQFIVIEAPTTTTFRIDIGHYWKQQVTITASNILLRQVDFTRPPTSINIATQTRYEYVLPGVSAGIGSVLDVELAKAFQGINISTGDPVTSLDNSTTIPSAANYITMIKNGHNITTEASLTKWAGNILLIKTKTCKAR